MTPAASEQAPPFVTKENLFSEHFLMEVLPTGPMWQQMRSFSERVQAKLGELLAHETAFRSMTELSLDREFFDPIFRELGHVSHIQVRTQAGKFPDYLFFENQDAKDEADRHYDDRQAFVQHAIAIGELKAWDRSLDGTGVTRNEDVLDAATPARQIYRYLLADEKRWGILTNGRKWRIYHYDNGLPKLGRYYEVDLVALASAPIEQFTYFTYFFRREAFIQDSTGKTVLDRVREGSIEYSKDLAKNLEDSVYRALGVLANGFLRWRENNLSGSNADHRKLIHDNSLKLLYRLLFILKAESAGLLPLDNPIYRQQRSLAALKHEIAIRKRSVNPILNDSDDYHRRLTLLCNLVDRGSAAVLARPGQPDPLGIPPYNGGLFRQVSPETGAKEFLAAKSVGDADLAEVIDLLARSAGTTIGEGFVDYTSLEASQLGTLYEGLLEYQLGFAEGEDYVASGDGEKWLPESKHIGLRVTDSSRRAPAGTIFLQTGKGERHATGSYYTPDFIVQEIVEKTLTPILERRMAKARAEHKNLRAEILHFRVLDPAMGSGHFLVGVIDFLTECILEAVEEDKAASRMAAEEGYTVEDARRDVVSHCVYGVDLNPMAVELAKVTLWLHTLAKGKPLTFLDHRLKVGNSLLGVNVRRLSLYPTIENQNRWATQVAAVRQEHKSKPFEQVISFPPIFLEKITGRIAQIDALRDDRIEDVKAKEKTYLELRQSPEFERIRAISDIWTAAWFGMEARNEPGQSLEKNYSDVLGVLFNPAGKEEWERKSRRCNYEAIRAFSKGKHFFHWEFEFPEVFFPDGELRDDSGFDAVVGNPPYLNIETLHSADPHAVEVFEKIYETAGEGRYDIYVMFVELGLGKLRPDGELGYILPNKWFKGEFGRPLRSLLLRNRNVREITDWRNYYTLFPGAVTFVALLYLSRLSQDAFRYVAFPSLTANDTIETAEELLHEAAISDEVRNAEMVVGRIPLSRFSSKPWNFATGDAHSLLTRLKKYPHFGKIAEVFEGVTTAATKVFYLREAREQQSTGTVRAWSEALEAEIEVEAELVRPLLNGQDVSRWRTLYDGDAILWHYDEVTTPLGGKTFALKSADQMASVFPRAWAYLNHAKVRAILEAREPANIQDPATGTVQKIGRFVGRPDWYCYSYPRSMNKFSMAKLVLPDAASQGDAAWDARGSVLANTLYGVVPAKSSNWSPFALQALLNNHLLTFWVREMGSPLKDGFYRFATKYVEPYPVPQVSWADDSKRRTSRQDIKTATSSLEDGQTSDLLGIVDHAIEDARLDIVHDVLEHLGSRLHDLYSSNFTETKAFLKWFERTHMKPEARLDNFAGKTKLQQFGEYQLNEILDVVRKNKKFMRSDPKSRTFQEEFEREFNSSVAQQIPRFTSAKRLEPVVEEVVYRLYSLTPEERAVVEEAAAAIQYK